MSERYRLRLNDVHEDPERCRVMEMDIPFDTIEAAAKAAWAIAETSVWMGALHLSLIHI